MLTNTAPISRPAAGTEASCSSQHRPARGSAGRLFRRMHRPQPHHQRDGSYSFVAGNIDDQVGILPTKRVVHTLQATVNALSEFLK